MAKKKSRRSKEKYPALKKQYNLKTRQELIEDFEDYVFELSEEELEWLNKFSEEYNNAKLDRKNLDNNLHNTPELKKDCDARNNARNRCILTKANASGSRTDMVNLYRQDWKDSLDNEHYEDQLIDIIDAEDFLKENVVDTADDTNQNSDN